MFQQQRPQPEIDLNQILSNIRASVNRFFGRFGGAGMGGIFLAILGLLVLVWLATGFYQVRPPELAALRLFGAYTGDLQKPGLHWFWPSPIGTVNKEAVTETRRMELGFRSLERGQAVDVSYEALMITGDMNIADVQLVIQYRIKDLAAYLFQVADPGDVERGIRLGAPEGFTLKDATEAALRQVVGQRSIDDVLTIKKEAVQVDTMRLLQQILDGYNTGIEILEVRLQNVRPPDIVRDAFDDVVRARVDKEARINEALAYQQDQLPRARGAVQKTVQAADAFKQERVLKATGEANRFLSVLAEYKESREVTRQRLYLEAMEDILPGVTKFIVDPDTGGNLLQFLPLEESKSAP